jgi:hypothetical protein
LLDQIPCSEKVGFFLVCMLPAIEFNDKLFAQTAEVDDKPSDRMLTAELKAKEAP